MEELKEISTASLMEELARRRGVAGKTIDEVEEETAQEGQAWHRTRMQEWLHHLEEGEDGSAKPCPRCGRAAFVHQKKRPRKVHTSCGEMSYRRNYHRCSACNIGFYPLDAEVGVPEEGRATERLCKRALDFAMNSPYAEAAERFSMHYGVELSTHALRCMVGSGYRCLSLRRWRILKSKHAFRCR